MERCVRVYLFHAASRYNTNCKNALLICSQMCCIPNLVSVPDTTISPFLSIQVWNTKYLWTNKQDFLQSAKSRKRSKIYSKVTKQTTNKSLLHKMRKLEPTTFKDNFLRRLLFLDNHQLQQDGPTNNISIIIVFIISLYEMYFIRKQPVVKPRKLLKICLDSVAVY